MTSPLLLSDCKKAVSDLKSLSNDELDKIMNDEEKIENILSSLDQSYLKEIETQKERLLESNRALAEENLSREPELVEGREKLQELSEQAEQLSKSVEEKVKQIKNKSGDLSLETSLALLQTAASEMEEKSDKLVKSFLENEIDLENFLDEFLTKRRQVHLRLIKAEQLSKIISRGPMGGTSNYVNAPAIPINSNYFPGVPSQNVPYPTGPIGMPMPGLNYFQNHF
ncbi:vacuolar protein sorting-associated protein 37C [Tribolium castaneum]|uniref:Vacuolar protein sorting-associated protein 37B-like Protein n=1 Tax=Tribolium castaneum TaxID=7070 RepID=D2A3L9_TRICA|nr:PREDICTED: vacuolar protein sorting-associated protein 37C [Tribolium castaneum]EFA04908.1 Vacuolar protein sorting-associated protein 37B-like Protein [Tribolium castaneum]|eukprot:XP_971915.1 PREDICTED: vacuolar protein sorting-associated protein 37C [Tribolium castaneum]